MNTDMESEVVFITKSARETQKIAKDFAQTLRGGDMVALYGDLGSGKTTFTQGLAEVLTDAKRIISPTFIIVRTYKMSSKYKVLGIKYFYHVDLYRTESSKDVEGLGLKEILSDSENVVAIEWAEKLGDLLPKERIDIFFDYIANEKRKIRIKRH